MRPNFGYHSYEQTAFDKVPVLEGVLDGLVYFGVVSLMRADGLYGKDGLPTSDPQDAYGGWGKLTDLLVGNVEARTLVIKFSDAFQRVKDDALAAYLEQRRRALLGAPVTVGVQVKSKPSLPKEALPKTNAPVAAPAPKAPVTTAELVLQMATMQADFDLRMRVMAERIVALEAK